MTQDTRKREIRHEMNRIRTNEIEKQDTRWRAIKHKTLILVTQGHKFYLVMIILCNSHSHDPSHPSASWRRGERRSLAECCQTSSVLKSTFMGFRGSYSSIWYFVFPIIFIRPVTMFTEGLVSKCLDTYVS